MDIIITVGIYSKNISSKALLDMFLSLIDKFRKLDFERI